MHRKRIFISLIIIALLINLYGCTAVDEQVNKDDENQSYNEVIRFEKKPIENVEVDEPDVELSDQSSKKNVDEESKLDKDIDIDKDNELTKERETESEPEADIVQEKDKIAKPQIVKPTNDTIKSDGEVITEEAVFTINEIDDEIKQKIVGKSWKKDCPIPIKNLRYLNLSCYGFDNETYIGEMIVHKDVAEDVIAIFKELYVNKYPVEKMKLIDDYEADDNKSMKDNNSSSFCYRKIANSNTISMHGYGLAIDINPLQNPYVVKKTVLPPEGKDFVDRSKLKKGMIIKNDVCYNAFINRGWSWGGDWTTPKDYQHFEKKITLNIE